MVSFSKEQMRKFKKRGTRPLLIGKFGLEEDPVGQHIVWNVGSRQYLATVEGVSRDELRGYTILKTRFFNGEEGPDVDVGSVQVLMQGGKMYRKDEGIPIGQGLRSSPFEFKGSKYVMDNLGRGLVDSFAVYQYSFGGPGGVPLAIKRGGAWVNYLGNHNPITDPEEIRKYDEIASTIMAKDYDRIMRRENNIKNERINAAWKEDNSQRETAIRADIDAQIKELNMPFRVFKDGHSEGTIRRGDVWSNTYLKHQRELGNVVTINDKRKQIIVESPRTKEERIL